jgi:hypothetical protein
VDGSVRYLLSTTYINDLEQELNRLKLKKLSQLITFKAIIAVEVALLRFYGISTADISGNVRVILPGMTACIDCTLDLFPPQVQGCGSALFNADPDPEPAFFLIADPDPGSGSQIRV